MKNILTKAKESPIILLPGVMVVFLVLTFVILQLVTHSLKSWEDTRLKVRLVSSLAAKKDDLESQEQTRLIGLANIATLALPEKNGALANLSRIRELSAKEGIVISRIKVSIIEGQQEIPTAALRLDLEGPEAGLLPFLGELEQSLPLIRLLGGRLSLVSGLSKTSISLESYWKKFPDKLPGVEETLPTLTAAEKELLSKLTTFKIPTPASMPLGGESRPNPFEF